MSRSQHERAAVYYRGEGISLQIDCYSHVVMPLILGLYAVTDFLLWLNTPMPQSAEQAIINTAIPILGPLTLWHVRKTGGEVARYVLGFCVCVRVRHNSSYFVFTGPSSWARPSRGSSACASCAHLCQRRQRASRKGSSRLRCRLFITPVLAGRRAA